MTKIHRPRGRRQVGASVRLSSFADFTDSPRDFGAELRRYGKRSPEGGKSDDRDKHIKACGFPTHLKYALELYGTHYGMSWQAAAAFTVGAGAGRLLSLPSIDVIRDSRAAVLLYGSALITRFEEFSFKVWAPAGRKTFDLHVTEKDRRSVHALAEILCTSPGQVIPLCVMAVLVEVWIVPGEVRLAMVEDLRRFVAALDERARQAREWAATARAAAAAARRQRGRLERDVRTSFVDALRGEGGEDGED